MKTWFLNILKNKKVLNAAVTIPIIAIGTMTGSCAASCPYGLVNDPYPGQCPRYLDMNGDGICDLSQTAVVTSSNTSGTTDDSSSNINSDAHSSVSNTNDSNSSINLDPNTGTEGSSFIDGSHFNVLPLSILFLGAYLFTHFLFSRGILSRKKHRRIWNTVLTVGFVGTGASGALLILLINLGIRTALNPSIDYLHAELSILMFIAAIVHIHIYRKPLKRMFKVMLNSDSQKTEKVKPSKYAK